MFNDFLLWQLIAIGIIFIWTGFVRTGFGFGGAALSLPLLLLVHDDPLFFLPIIGFHLLFFSSLTLHSRLHQVNWGVVWRVIAVMIIPKMLGILGLLSFPNTWIVILVFVLTALYGAMWLLDYAIKSKNRWLDGTLLIIGGYVSGTSLIGAPLVVSVVMRYVEKYQLRETLLVLWFILVVFKMSAFAITGVDLQWEWALLLIPLAAIGHVLGLRAHDKLVHSDDNVFRRIVGGVLVVVSLAGLVNTLSG